MRKPPRALVRLKGAVYSVWTRWAGLDLVVRVGPSPVTMVAATAPASSTRGGSVWSTGVLRKQAAPSAHLPRGEVIVTCA